MTATVLFIHGFLDDATVWDGVIEALAGKVDDAGGTKLAGPFPAGPGQVAIVRDPQGGVFALYTGNYDS